jgi:hypothetical protein
MVSRACLALLACVRVPESVYHRMPVLTLAQTQARVVAARKRARKRLAAKRKNVGYARPQVTTSTRPKFTPLRRMLYIAVVIVKVCFRFTSNVAAIVEMFFRPLFALLSPLLAILEVISAMLECATRWWLWLF